MTSKLLHSEADEERLDLEFWKRELDDLPPPFDLPFDHPPSSHPTIASYPFPLTPTLPGRLEPVGSLEPVLAGALSVLIHRYTGRDDIVISLRSAAAGGEPFILRTSRIAPALPFRELLRQVNDRMSGARSRRPVAPAKLLRELGYEGQVQVGLTIGEAAGPTLERDGLGCLAFSFAKTPAGLGGAIEYRADLFDSSTIARMAAQFEVLLDGIASDPEGLLGKLPLLPERERRKIIGWNEVRQEVPCAFVTDWFLAQVARSPSARALCFEGEELTYQALNVRAERVAQQLRARGVRAEVLVGICLDRSPEMVVAILAVLKSGGAFLPLDPAYPEDRLQFMLADSGAQLVITTTDLRARVAGAAEVLLIGDDAASTTSSPAVEVEPHANDLAYVIYTSGSTGKPKGVMVTHRGLSNLAQEQIRSFFVTPESRVLQYASFSFDACVSEILMTLLSGAVLYMAPRSRLLPGPELLRLLRDESITTVTLPPSVLALMSIDQLPRLGTIVTAGEACPPEVAERWSHGRRLINAYGPTEATVCATIADPAPPGRQHRFPIGRPMRNTEAWVLNEAMELVPIGVPGELYLGGIGLARGYLHRPDLTAERFVAHPFASLAGEPRPRLYKTGDLCRLLDDGNIDFLGRIDHQVKIRGHRIEPGEIEAKLRAHPGVRDALVLARKSPPGGTRLIAYVVGEKGAPPNSQALRRFVKASLPDYMVPSNFVVLSDWPMTPNGKVDRDRLPLPDRTRPELGNELVEARDETELMLVPIWEKILAVQPIGVTDDFFELGGDSLMAASLLLHLESLGSNVDPSALFRTPTIEGLATHLRTQGPAATPSVLVRMRDGASRPFFCVHPVTGSVLCYLDLVRGMDGDRPVIGLQAQAPAEDEPRPTVASMSAEYLTAIRTIQPRGPYLLGGWSAGGTIAHEMACQLMRDGESVERLVLFDADAPEPMDLSQFDDARLAYLLIRNLNRCVGRDSPVSMDQMQRLEPAAIVDRLDQAFRELKYLPPGGGLANTLKLFHVFKTVFHAVNTHRGSMYPGRITLLKAADGHAGNAELGVAARAELLGWDTVTTQPIEVQLVPGTHYTMVYRPHASGLARALTGCLGPNDSRERG